MVARCCHRGTTLYYGRVEERGIRCCYHGWLFDVEGHCLEQPCEPGGGRIRERIRQPWYPVQERYGLIFAYMGPPAEAAGAAALRVPRNPGCRRDDRSRRFQHRQRRRRDRAVQLAAALGEHPRCLPCADPARLIQRRAVRGADGHHAQGAMGAVAGWREDRFGARTRGRPRALPHHRGGAPGAARGAEPAGRPISRRRVARVGAADRRHPFPHLCRRAGQGQGRARARSARA